MRFASYFWPGDLEFSVVSVMLKSWMSSWRSTRPVDTLIMESDRNGLALCQIPCSFFSNIYGRFEKAFARSGCTKIVALGYAANEMPNCVALLTLPDLGGSTTVSVLELASLHMRYEIWLSLSFTKSPRVETEPGVLIPIYCQCHAYFELPRWWIWSSNSGFQPYGLDICFVL